MWLLGIDHRSLEIPRHASHACHTPGGCAPGTGYAPNGPSNTPGSPNFGLGRPTIIFNTCTTIAVHATAATRSSNRRRLAGSISHTHADTITTDPTAPNCCNASNSRTTSPPSRDPTARAAPEIAPSNGNNAAAATAPAITTHVRTRRPRIYSIGGVSLSVDRGLMGEAASSITQPHPPLAGRRAGVLLVLLALAVYLPGLFSIPPVDRDESRFAQASRQMFESVALDPADRDPALHSGGLIIPNVAARPRLNKPPLIYWLQSASAWACTAGHPARDAIWMYRLPSVVGALVAVLATWRIARTMMPPAPAFLAGALLAVSPIVVWDAHQARADQVLLACTTVAMGALWRLWSMRTDRPRWTPALTFWIALALAVLTKGPITPMIAALTVLSLCIVSREWRWLARLRPAIGLPLLLAIVLPWVIAVAQRVGWHEYACIVYDETLGRSTGAKEGHWAPPGYHTLLSAVLFWPGSLLTLAAVARALRAARPLAPSLPDQPRRSLIARWRARETGDDTARFLLAWLLPSWIVFELVSTKLPHYTMPLYPALALLTALAVADVLARAPGAIDLARHRLGLAIWILIGLGWVAAMPGALAVAVGGNIGIPFGALTAVVALVTLLFGTVPPTMHRRPVALHLVAVLTLTLSIAVSLGVLLPRARTIWVSPRLAEILADHPGPVAAVGYHEDSLVFLTRGRLDRIRREDAPAWLAAHPDGVLIAPPALTHTLEGVHELGAVDGFNYSTGHAVHLRIVRP